jgi:tetratricopeptide (TPR) repeat protein
MSTRIEVTIATTMAASLFCCRPPVAFAADSQAPGTRGGGDSVRTSATEAVNPGEHEHYVLVSDDSGVAHYALGGELVKQGKTVPIKLVEGYKELRTALTKNWEADQQPVLSKCHAKLGEILFDMAHLARENGNSEVALKRLINADIEYRRAVTVDPLNSDAARRLVEVSKELVSISPSFDNHLMLAGAYNLVQDRDHALQEYQKCYKMDNGEMIKRYKLDSGELLKVDPEALEKAEQAPK